MGAIVTTIAFKDGVLASDSAAFYGDYRSHDDAIKIVRCDDGSLLGACGDMVALDVAREWINGGKVGRVPLDGNSTALHVTKQGVWVYESHGAFKMTRTYYAMGSGGIVARVAMECGKSAPEAVKLATKFDPWSGGRVRKLVM